MDEADALRVFVRVVETGSFAAAAREAGIGQPAVSKRIAALERQLGTQLLRRTSRSMSLTQNGQTLFDAAARLVGELDAVMALVGRGQSTPAGVVRVTVAPAFGQLYLVPRLPILFAQHPNLTIEMIASERIVNLVEDGIDLAVQHGVRADASTVARSVATTALVTVATPRYLALHGTPKMPRQLADHACVVFAPLRTPRPWRYVGAVIHKPVGNFRSADAEQLRAAVLADLGIAHGPDWLFATDLASGAVRAILARHQLPATPIKLAWPAGRHVAMRVRVVIDFLAAQLGSAQAAWAR